MGLFGDSICPACGGKLGALSGLLLKDDNRVCGDCAKLIDHDWYQEYPMKNWTLEDFKAYRQFLEDSKERNQSFHADHTFGYLEMDWEHGWFRISDKSKNTKIFLFRDLCFNSFTKSCWDVQKALFGGAETYLFHVYLSFALKDLNIAVSPFIKDIKVCYRKAEMVPDKTGKMEMEDLIETELLFNWYTLLSNPAYEGFVSDHADGGKIGQAMDLFMIDSLDEKNLEELKLHRNALIKAFHPDNGEQDAAYAQKINTAYRTILNAMKSKGVA